MNLQVDLVYDSDCPNVELARRRLREALSTTDSRNWREWNRLTDDVPEPLRGFGSPSILVGGTDVSASCQANAACCRLYRLPDGSVSGAPSVQEIRDAIAAWQAFSRGGSG